MVIVKRIVFMSLRDLPYINMNAVDKFVLSYRPKYVAHCAMIRTVYRIKIP